MEHDWDLDGPVMPCDYQPQLEFGQAWQPLTDDATPWLQWAYT
ncbi:hypothetical protein [Leptolyngbya sp. KIOST-1]|nr:hypothetical protein [Leptolyngbya sp. KIOST-1]